MKSIFAVLLLVLPFGLWAQGKESPNQDSVLTSAFRLNEVILLGNLHQDPAMSEVRTEPSKRVVQPRNVADLFAGINGFSLIRRGNYAMDPSLRGNMYEQLNVMFDGGTRILHACPNRMDPITTHVSPEEIERIEVIKGPYSVRYGPAFGGIINLVTRDSRALGEGLHGHLSSGYESNGDSYLNTLRLQQVWERTDLGFQFGWRDFGDYTDGDGRIIPSSFESMDYKLELGREIAGGQRLELNWRQSFGRDVLHAGLPMDTREDNSSMLSVDYHMDQTGTVIHSLTAKAFYSYVDHLMTNEWRPSFERVSAVSAVDARTFGGRFEAGIRPEGKWSTFAGVDFNTVSRDGNRNRLVKTNMAGNPLPEPVIFTEKVWQDSRLSDLGIFMESRWEFTQRTWLTAGLRMDAVFSDIRDVEADFESMYPGLGSRSEVNLGGHLSLKTRLGAHMLWETALGRGVRSANMIERFINHFTVGQDPFEYVGNPLLNPEVNHQLETGIRREIPSRNGRGQVRYAGSVYYSRVRDYILPVIDPELSRKYMPAAQPSEVKRFENMERAIRTGFEARFGMDFLNYFSGDLQLNYIYTRNYDLKESLPLTPPFNGSFTLGFERGAIWANIRYSLTARQGEIAPSFGETVTPGYQLLDLRAGTEVLSGMQIGLAALNVLDEQYADHLNFSFVNQEDLGRVPITNPGRNLSVYIQYTF